jgi:adenylate cyclase, class 2
VAEKVETEIKLRMDDAEKARAAVRALGARLVRDRHFEDNLILDDAAGSLAAAGKALRLRRAAGAAVLTFKGPRQGPVALKSRPEIEAAIPDPDSFEAILGGLGYRKVFRYQKYRETYAWKDVEIVVDETPVGTFLEIEGEEAAIHEAAAALGRGPQDYLTASYATLFFSTGRSGDMVFP